MAGRSSPRSTDIDHRDEVNLRFDKSTREVIFGWGSHVEIPQKILGMYGWWARATPLKKIESIGMMTFPINMGK